MDPKDILSFVFQRADQTQVFWNLYATASTAILGFVAAAKSEWLNKSVCTVLSCGFAVFAYGNLQALNHTRQQREGLLLLLSSLKDYPPSIENVASAARPSSLVELLLFHITLDLFVISMIWLIPRIRTRASATDP